MTYLLVLNSKTANWAELNRADLHPQPDRPVNYRQAYPHTSRVPNPSFFISCLLIILIRTVLLLRYTQLVVGV